MKNKYSSGLLFLAVFALVLGCNKDKFEPENIHFPQWQPVLAFPIATEVYTVADILDTMENSTSIDVDQNGLISLVYSGNLYSFRPDEILQIPDQDFVSEYSIPASEQLELLSGESVNLEESVNIPFEIPTDEGGELVRLDKVFIKSGTMTWFIQTTADLMGDAILRIEELKNSLGEVFEVQLAVSPGMNDLQLDLSGYLLDLTQTEEDNVLTLSFNTTISAGDDFAQDDSQFSFGAEMVNIVFKRVEGYFGHLTLNTDQDSIELDIFNNIQGYAFVVEPQIELITHNSFGMTAEVEFVNFQSFDQNTGVNTPLINNGFPNPFIIEGANSVDQPVSYSLQINNQNSNLPTLLTTSPKYIFGQVVATSNPENNSDVVNFIDEESKLDVDVDIDIPLWGRASIFFTDTFDLKLNDIDNVEDVDSASVRFNFANGFPISLLAQVYLVDSLDQITDSLFINGEERIISSGIVNSEGVVTQSTQTLFDVPLTNERLEVFTGSEKIILKASVKTTNEDLEENVKFYDHYSMGFDLGVKLFLNKNLNEEI